MNFKELLEKYKTDKTRVIINGLGAGETRGLITEVNEDYITYELLDIRKEKKAGKETGKEKQTKEVKYIPISNIVEVSEGEKESDGGTQGLGSFTT